MSETIESYRVPFHLMMEELAQVGWRVLEGISHNDRTSAKRDALADVGLLLADHSNLTRRGWRVLAAWWEEGPGEGPPGSLCRTAELAENASYMATGSFAIRSATPRAGES